MKCWKCNKTAVIDRKFEGKAWCSEHFLEQFDSAAKRLVRQENLIDNGDHVFVALSGGMDSSAVLYFLNNLLADWRNTKLSALAIDEGINNYRKESLNIAKDLCKELNIELHIESFEDNFGKSLDQIVENLDKAECTYCGVLRRWLLNKKSKELGATKLATGHNLDDELQSVFMNYLKGNMKRMIRLGAKPAVINHDKFVTRIKPFRDIREKEVALYAKLNGLDLHKAECPYVQDSIRFDVRDFLNKMEQKHPSTKYTALRAFDKILPALKEMYGNTEDAIMECKKCSELTSQEICKTCKLIEEIENK